MQFFKTQGARRLMTCVMVGLLVQAVPMAELHAAEPRTMHTEAGGLYVPVGRSELVVAPGDVSEVLIADPEVSDVHVIGTRRIAFIGKKMGRTNAKLFDKNNQIVREFDVVVGYDLPAMRKALHSFLPNERIGVELLNTNVALTGEVSDAASVRRAMDVANQFVGAPVGAGAEGSTIINLMKVNSGQQVMLRVRVGEVQRTALKNLGINTSVSKGGSVQIFGGALGGINRFLTGTSSSPTGGTSGSLGTGGLGPFLINGDDTLALGTGFDIGSANIGVVLEALEREGLFKVLAEPNLVAISGEKAEFLAGGEFPIPVPQTTGGTSVNTVQFKNYGVAVQFIPYVQAQNRIRIVVAPEVSEIDTTQSTTANGVTVPGLTTRRAKTTVELAPGESFMIAGLISDRMNSTINQVPGAAEIPVLGALLRSTSYQRKETELVIAVTPYLVDPLKSGDVRLPTDDFRPASVMESFFYGALGSMSGDAYRISQTPSLEGPIGFLVD